MDENDRNRTVSDNELDEFCHENHYVGWFTTSAKTGLNVKKGMDFLIRKIAVNIRLGLHEPVDQGNTNRVRLDSAVSEHAAPTGKNCAC